MNICILILTCEKYLDLAILTVTLIKQRWKNHPPIFVCGVSFLTSEGVEILPFEGDQRDWIGMVSSAALQLLEKGFQTVYLILDDHPPLGVCNDEHLNHTLPNLMDKLGAAYIGLYGWDQSTFSQGTIMSKEFHKLQIQDKSFLWRYSLHPALWRLEALRDISTAILMRGNDLLAKSAWAFERISGSSEIYDAISQWEGRSYRIFGLGMLEKKHRIKHMFFRRLFYIFTNGTLLAIKKIFGAYAQERFSALIIAERLFFDGPYPLYWSGVMQKGKLNKNFEKFMCWRRRYKELFMFQNALKNGEN